MKLPTMTLPTMGRPATKLQGAALVVALALTCFATWGCGHSHPTTGNIVVDNRTDLTTNEALLSFFVAPFGQPFTGDLLGGVLPVLSSRFVGTFNRDYYDAEGELELGGLIEWFDLFVGDGGTTVFEVR